MFIAERIKLEYQMGKHILETNVKYSTKNYFGGEQDSPN